MVLQRSRALSEEVLGYFGGCLRLFLWRCKALFAEMKNSLRRASTTQSCVVTKIQEIKGLFGGDINLFLRTCGALVVKILGFCLERQSTFGGIIGLFSRKYRVFWAMV